MRGIIDVDYIEVDSVEEIKADFIDKDYIVEPTYKMSRVDVHGHRHYIKEEDGVLTQAPAYSTIYQATAKTSYYIIQWMLKHGKEKAAWLVDNAANYGTFFHVLCGMYLMKQAIPLSKGLLMFQMQQFFEDENLNFGECAKWMQEEKRDLRKDIFGFATFCKDYIVNPIAIEYPMMDEEGQYACTADIICKMEYKKEIVTALIDIKSGRKGFYESHEIQLEAQRRVWDYEHPELTIDKMFNLGCHDFRIPLSPKVTPYKLENQTNSTNLYKWDLYLQLWHGDIKKEQIKPVVDFNFDTVLHVDNPLEDIFVETDYMEIKKESF